MALVRESRNLNEYAFALGALPHYAADTNGHRIATVRAVPILYPELHRKFGRTATGRDNPLSHIRTEFGVDALQAAQGSYAPGSHSSGMADEERYARQRNSGRTVAAGTRSEGRSFRSLAFRTSALTSPVTNSSATWRTAICRSGGGSPRQYSGLL